MTMDLLLSLIADPFRIVLIIGLVVTMLRTEAVTGRYLPLAAGVVFVAVLIPLTTGAGQAPFWQAAVAGVIANCIILAVALVGWTIWRRLRR